MLKHSGIKPLISLPFTKFRFIVDILFEIENKMKMKKHADVNVQNFGWLNLAKFVNIDSLLFI